MIEIEDNDYCVAVMSINKQKQDNRHDSRRADESKSPTIDDKVTQLLKLTAGIAIDFPFCGEKP
jgi:hypothetical protein